MKFSTCGLEYDFNRSDKFTAQGNKNLL